MSSYNIIVVVVIKYYSGLFNCFPNRIMVVTIDKTYLLHE